MRVEEAVVREDLQNPYIVELWEEKPGGYELSRDIGFSNKISARVEYEEWLKSAPKNALVRLIHVEEEAAGHGAVVGL